MYNFFDWQGFRKVLEKKGISQSYIAKKLGVTRNAVNEWANGNKKPSEKNLTELCAILEIDPRYLKGEITRPTEEEHIKEMFEKIDTSVNEEMAVRRAAESFLAKWLSLNGYNYVRSVMTPHRWLADQIGDHCKTFPGAVKSNKEYKLEYYIYSKDPRSEDRNLLNPGIDEIVLTIEDLRCFPLELLQYVKMRLGLFNSYRGFSDAGEMHFNVATGDRIK